LPKERRDTWEGCHGRAGGNENAFIIYNNVRQDVQASTSFTYKCAIFFETPCAAIIIVMGGCGSHPLNRVRK
jgi:hypothetical protein